MKNLKLLVLLLAVIISSCKKNESKPDVQTSIIGKWELKANTQISYKNGVKEEEYTYYPKSSAEFMNDGKTIFDGANLTYKIEGNNRLLLIYPGETKPDYDFEITNLTANELILSSEELRTAKNGDVIKTITQLSFAK